MGDIECLQNFQRIMHVLLNRIILYTMLFKLDQNKKKSSESNQHLKMPVFLNRIIFFIFQIRIRHKYLGVFCHLRKNPVKIFTTEQRKGPRQKISGIIHPLSYKVKK